MMHKYIIPGKPVPWARPCPGKNGMFDTQKKVKDLYRAYMRNQCESGPLSGALIMDVTFYMSIPRTISFKKRDALSGTPHSIKPDASNLLKFVEDCANMLLYADDAQLATIRVKKIWDENPRTEFTLWEIADEENEE